MRIIYHPLTTSGADYSAGNTPSVYVNKLGDPQTTWNGTAFTTDLTQAQLMTSASVGAGDWTYDIADANFDTESRYQVIAQVAGAVSLSVTGTPAQLEAIFFTDSGANSTTTTALFLFSTVPGSAYSDMWVRVTPPVWCTTVIIQFIKPAAADNGAVYLDEVRQLLRA